MWDSARAVLLGQLSNFLSRASSLMPLELSSPDGEYYSAAFERIRLTLLPGMTVSIPSLVLTEVESRISLTQYVSYSELQT